MQQKKSPCCRRGREDKACGQWAVRRCAGLPTIGKVVTTVDISVR
ncbi:hypothetical protein [Serratia rubidaea]|nr:hypothetical protein [Serratia rubidaea]MDC6117386.1 hypothetical protein [Serratia rubidaea]